MSTNNNQEEAIEKTNQVEVEDLSPSNKKDSSLQKESPKNEDKKIQENPN